MISLRRPATRRPCWAARADKVVVQDRARLEDEQDAFQCRIVLQHSLDCGDGERSRNVDAEAVCAGADCRQCQAPAPAFRSYGELAHVEHDRACAGPGRPLGLVPLPQEAVRCRPVTV